MNPIHHRSRGPAVWVLIQLVAALALAHSALAQPLHDPVALSRIAPSSPGPNVRLTQLALQRPSLPSFGYACSDYDRSVCHDLNAFYRPKQANSLLMEAVVQLKPDLGLRIGYAEGLEAEKVSLDDSLRVGVLQLLPASSGRFVSIELSTLFGGALRHRPCIDSYGRSYFCGSLTSWEDFQGKTLRPYDYRLRIHTRF